MKKCFTCLRRLRLVFRSKREDKKWMYFIENYCSHHSKFQWCELVMENFDEIRKYTNVSEDTLRELRSTNISS